MPSKFNKEIQLEDADRQCFAETLAEVCAKTSIARGSPAEDSRIKPTPI